MPKQIRSSFRACDLILDVLCGAALSKDVNSVIDAFQSEKRGSSTLLLDGDGFLQGVASDLLSAKRWQSGRLEVAVRDVGVEVVSAAIGILLSLVLSENRGLLLHGAFLLKEDRAHLFLGRSGAGKSTIALNAKGMRCVHEDKLAVRKVRGQWWAYGIPMLDNQGTVGLNLSAPVEGVYLIERGSKLEKRSLAKKTVLAELPEHVIEPLDDAAIKANTFENMMDWIVDSKVWRLSFQKDSNVKLIV